MSKLTVERGFNGVAFVKLDNKPALSISSYGNRAVAMQILDMMVSAPELMETLVDMTAVMERAIAVLDAGGSVDIDELRRCVDSARARLASSAQ